MKTVCSFVAKFASLISWDLSCFDRVIFKGHLPFGYASKFAAFVDYELKMRRADFMRVVAPAWSEHLVEHGKAYAKKHDRLYEYYQGDIDKDAWAKEQWHKQLGSDGLIGVLCVMESCPTFKLAHGEGRPCFVSKKVPQRVLYYYFWDKDLGLLHVRLQTWAPFTCQIYVNGHDYVMQKMTQRGLGFEKIDNAFVRLDDPKQAQRIAHRFAELPWPKILEKYARLVNPLLHKELKNLSHYWVIDQAEFATDLSFTSKHALAGLFVRLLEYALLTFSPKKIFQYLGRKWHERFDGEVQTWYKTEREPGACLKHYLKKNWLKMYDKLGLLVRVETVINQPGEFKVFRECQHRDGSTSKKWLGMCKGVGNLHHYQRHALACNQRYLEALTPVADPTPGYDDLKTLTEPKRQQGRSSAGFNPAREEDSWLFAAVLAGDHIGKGFRNQDIRQALYGNARDKKRRHRQSATIGRLLHRLHVRGLVRKVAHTRLWRATERGRRIMGDTLRTYRRYSAQAA
jgi:hypothetical protein